jgi:hypothetical protein
MTTRSRRFGSFNGLGSMFGRGVNKQGLTVSASGDPDSDLQVRGQARASVLDGIGVRIKSMAHAIAWQEFDGPASSIPLEQLSRGPLGSVGHSAGLTTSSAARSVTRAAASQLGALTSVAVNDRSIRVLVTRGNRILHWATADLPPGVVDDGTVIDAQRFTSALESVVGSLHEGSTLERRKAGVIISGRNTVQGRFVLMDNGDDGLDYAVRGLAAERMSVTPEDVQLDWDAQPLEPTDDEATQSSSDEDEDDGEPIEVYALGIFRNVLESNLRPVKMSGMKVSTVAPKPLALAAAVAEESAIVVDIQLSTVSVVIVKDGLPEVVRDMRSSEGLDALQWGRALSAHIEKSVEFHDVLNPQAPMGAETPAYVSGRDADAERVRAALEERRYRVVSMPDLLGAPHGFPMGEMAANVGMAVLRGGKPWQRSSASEIDRPALKFVPPAYEPRTLPIKPIAATAAAAVFSVGLAAGYGQVSELRGQGEDARAELVTLERRLDLKSDQLRQLVRDQALVTAVRADAEAVLTTSEAIRDPDGGFSRTLDAITSSAPEGVSIQEVDDDGGIVNVRATAATYDLLLHSPTPLKDPPA